jgi:hypothetical protein
MLSYRPWEEELISLREVYSMAGFVWEGGGGSASIGFVEEARRASQENRGAADFARRRLEEEETDLGENRGGSTRGFFSPLPTDLAFAFLSQCILLQFGPYNFSLLHDGQPTQ